LIAMGLPLYYLASLFALWVIVDQIANRCALASGQLHTPGISHMGQQQVGDFAVCIFIPVHPIILQVLLEVPKVEIQV
jgi:hypothetical protein